MFKSEETARKLMAAYKAYIVADATCAANVTELWAAYKAAEAEHVTAIT